MDYYTINTMSYWPGRLVWGIGALKELINEIEQFRPKNILIVTDKWLSRSDACESIENMLNGYEFELVEIEENPAAETVEREADRARKIGVDLLIALGGGSPNDAAKAIAILTTHKGAISDFDITKGGDKKITAATLPIISIPTTSGTGTEVSEAAVITITDQGQSWKAGIVSRHIIPKVSIMDPLLTVSMSPLLTAATGADALSHAIEAYVSDRGIPFAEAIALKAIEMIAEYLPLAVYDGNNLIARSEMLMASMMACLAVNHNSLGLCHSMAHQLTTLFGVSHGLANAILLPYVMEFNLPVVTDKLINIAAAFGEQKGGSKYDNGYKAIQSIKRFNQQIGIPLRLSEIGIKKEDLPVLARITMEKDRLLQRNPRKVSISDILQVFSNAY